MSIRTRILLASALIVLLPVSILAFGIRREMNRRLSDQYQGRVESLVAVIEGDLKTRGEDLAGRLASLKAEIADDNRFRLGAVERLGRDRTYVLDYAEGALQISGLSMLQIHDRRHRIVSSGHFRNEYDRVEPSIPLLLEQAADRTVLVPARLPDGEFLALARVDSVRLGGELFTILGGISVGRALLSGLSHDPDLAVSLVYSGGALSSDPQVEEKLEAGRRASRAHPEAILSRDYFRRIVEIPVALPLPENPEQLSTARLIVSYPLAPLTTILDSLDRWLALVLIATAVNSLILALWLSARISRPIGDLAQKTAEIDLDHLDADFSSNRRDEVGVLSRFLAAMTDRLRSHVERLRAAESRATLGELARQVNHDIRNGFTPIRNVVRHLSEVAHENPADLVTVFSERQKTLEASLAYLEDLATNYARLSVSPDRKVLSLNEVVRQVVSPATSSAKVTIRSELARDLPFVLADPVGLRRIIENLVRNARESIGQETGLVTVTTKADTDELGEPVAVLLVRDTGCGIPPGKAARIFDHFYTTKEGGTGLGLSIVKRLVSDFDGNVSVESERGRGSVFTVVLPAATAAATEGADAPVPQPAGEARPAAQPRAAR